MNKTSCAVCGAEPAPFYRYRQVFVDGEWRDRPLCEAHLGEFLRENGYKGEGHRERRGA